MRETTSEGRSEPRRAGASDLPLLFTGTEMPLKLIL
jgi:hypothetical protein